jgi:transposase
MNARHRVSKLLLRQGIVYCAGRAWTVGHESWLRGQRFDNAALQLSYEAAFDAMLACLDRRNRLDEAIAAMAADSEVTALVHRLSCIRGISTLTAFGMAVEIGDWHRLTGRSIGAYVGLVPSEILLRKYPYPRWGHQDRKRTRPPVAGGSGLASSQPLSTRSYASAALGPGLTGCSGARPGGQPAIAQPLGGLRRPQEASGGRQRGDRT